MDRIFLKLLEMSIKAGWLILAVIGLRLLFKRAPKWIRCVLWSFVAIRLICPISFQSAWSLIPGEDRLQQKFLSGGTLDSAMEVEQPQKLANDTTDDFVQGDIQPYSGPGTAHPFTGFRQGEMAIPEDRGNIVIHFMTAIWALGLVVMSSYGIIAYIKIRKNVSAAIPLWGQIKICDEINTAFILGMIRPQIYLPSDLKEPVLGHVLAHEEAHLSRRDHWWKACGFVLLTVYWFHPLVWIAYFLLCRDLELACDEKVIRNLALEEKKGYAGALLSCSTSSFSLPMCPLAFGEPDVKERVWSVLHYRKPAFGLLAISVIVCLVTAMCFLTEPETILAEEPEEKLSEVLVSSMENSAKDSPVPTLDHGVTLPQNGEKLTENSTAEKIADLLDTLCLVPSPLSAPGAYKKANPEAYQELLSYGEETLQYCFQEFRKGNQTDLRGHMMAMLCREVMEAWGEENDFFYTNGQEWFHAFLQYTESLQERLTEEEIERNYPAAWLLLQIM